MNASFFTCLRESNLLVLWLWRSHELPNGIKYPLNWRSYFFQLSDTSRLSTKHFPNNLSFNAEVDHE
jgi:hypothetical protein